MTRRRHLAWVRLLCAIALGFGLSGTAAVAITASGHARPGVAQLQGVGHDVAAATARAPLVLRHVSHRHVLPTVGSAFLATAALVGALALAARRHHGSATGDGRRTSSNGARAPPVAIGI